MLSNVFRNYIMFFFKNAMIKKTKLIDLMGLRCPLPVLKIAKKIIHYVKPKWIRIVSVWNPRGGIPIDVFFEEGIAPKKVHIQDLNMNIYKPR